jgi:hypothetical protein
MLMPVHLFIISRQHNDLYDYLRERLAGDGDVRVIKDRRLGERRRKAAPAAAERRRAERRSRPEIDEQLRVRSHAIVAVSSEATPLRDTLTTADREWRRVRRAVRSRSLAREGWRTLVQWVETVQNHVTVVRGGLIQHDRCQREIDAVKQEHERLRAAAERSRGELEHVDAQLARAITIVNDLLARMRGGSASGHAP